MPTLTPPEVPRAPNTPSVVILGNDAQLAARPATPVQLAHACLAAGFRAVVPASWGDELVAGATLTALRSRTTQPSIHCTCPHVARRVLASGSELAPHLVSLVAPPVAAARYLRANSDGDIRVTYVGRCPAAADDSIDARLTPEELLAQLGERGIDVATQPEVFESVIPPDRRRHLSLPGGVPAPETLWFRARVSLETMKSGDFASELADLVLGRSDALIDAAPLVGCACAGAVRGAAPEEARAAIIALEPPRSAHPVVDDTESLSLELRLPALARDTSDLVADRATPHDPRALEPGAGTLGDAPPPPPPVPNRRPRLTPPGITAIPANTTNAAGSLPAVPAAAPPRRRSPIGTPRVVPGAVPVSSDSEGRVLPRAYVARRRSPRSGVPVVSEAVGDSGTAARDAATPPPPAPAPRHTVPAAQRGEPSHPAVESERPVSRSVEPPPAVVSPSTGASLPIAASTSGPTAAPQSAPLAAADVPRPAVGIPPAFAASLTRGVAALRQRSWLVIACAIAGTGLLLGAAIGYAFAHRGSTPASAADASGRDSSASAEAARSSGVRESVSAGGIAPSPNAGSGTPSRRAPARAAERTVAARQRATVPPAAATTRPRPAVTPPVTTPAPSTTAPPNPAPSVDSARAVARRDSTARADSLAAERDAIRREIEIRRARMDSIERARRRIDSLQRAELPPPPDR